MMTAYVVGIGPQAYGTVWLVNAAGAQYLDGAALIANPPLTKRK
jgi:hypothetical protein